MDVRPVNERIMAKRLRVARRRVARERRFGRMNLVIGITIVGGIVLLCALQPVLPLPPPLEQNYDAVLQPPSVAHLFGTDNLGRDVLSRTLAGGRLDIPIASIVTVFSVVVGLTLGTLSGFFGGFTDAVVGRAVDIVVAFPFLVAIIAIIAIFGPGLVGIVVGIPLVGWAVYARLSRAELLVAREQEYMLATEVLGFSRRRTLFRHALPNIWRGSIAFCVIDFVLNVVAIASLSYLGLGVQPPTPEWGAVIAEGQPYILTAWWISILPGLLVVVFGVGASLIGDAVIDKSGSELVESGVSA